MFLYGRKIRGVSIKHPLGQQPDLPTHTDPDRLRELTASLKGGDDSCMPEVARGFTRLAISIAAQYAVSAPDKAHDLVSEAMLAIVATCHKVMAGEMEGDDLSKYVAMKIHSALAAWLRKDHIIRVPHSTNSDNGFSIKPPNVVLSVKLPARKIGGNPYRMLELREMLDMAIGDDEVARRVIELRAKEMVDREVAEQLGLSLSRVAQIRAEVAQRFLELENAS